MDEIHTSFRQNEVAEICELLFLTAAEGLVVVDGKGRIVLLNPRIEDLFGYTPAELQGRSIEILIPESVRGKHTAQRAEYQEAPSKRTM
ncbi:MAG: PAS domain S-box protein, partial [Flavobacteriales bacterium]|nr:PAS domain S-box protein [Flavobacteriales bacterium]